MTTNICAAKDAACAEFPLSMRCHGCPQGQTQVLTDSQIDELWLYRKSIHGGDLTLQLRNFARAILAATPQVQAQDRQPTHPMLDGYKTSVLTSDAHSHRLSIDYKSREQADRAQEWLASGQAQSPQSKERPCTCHPDDLPPRPCPRKYAIDECRLAHVISMQGNSHAKD